MHALPLSPGQYLRLRRRASGLGVIQAAATLATLPWAIRQAGPDERARLAMRLTAAEEDRQPFSRDHAELVRNVFAFDVDVYCDLLAGNAVHVCRSCGCSWHDPCALAHPVFLGRTIGCAWSADPSLCTACVEDEFACAQVALHAVAPLEGSPA
jgi:hypothetical protein